MRWRKFCSIFTLVAALGALGCGKSSSSSVSVAIAPVTASVITNRTQPYSAQVTGSSNTNVTWSVTCATGVAANTCGSIQTTGTDSALYTAPPTIPTTTSNGTTTIAPTVTITATSQADTTKSAAASLTIVTGISIVITPTTATVGTSEHFTFSATVNNPGCNITSNPTCENVTWSVPTSTTNPNPNGGFCSTTVCTTLCTTLCTTGNYNAPGSAISSVVITATSVADTSVTATATVTVVTASVPTVTSVSPNITASGGVFQDIYITGTNFISTDNVFICAQQCNGSNGVLLSPTFVTNVSASIIRARIPDYILAAPPQPSGIIQIAVSEQSASAQQTCPSTDLTPCQITVMGVRPGLIGPSPNTISQGSGVLSFNVDGGFFGTLQNPAVSATYNGQLRGVQPLASQTNNSTRNLSITIGGGSNAGDFTLPGLYPVAIRNATDATKFSVTNLAVQPQYVPPTPTTIAVGSVAASAPMDVAINPATGIAVVANSGSNDVSLVNLTTSPPSKIADICTAAVGAALPCPSSGPSSVSVDYVRNIALVVNSATKTIAVVDLTAQTVTSVTSPLTDTPGAVGINPVTGRALVAMQSKNYGILMDLTQHPPAQIGVVTLTTGLATHVAVEPHLNWALATPGGQGALGIVDLSRQSVNTIATLSRTSNTVLVTIQSTSTSAPLAVHFNDAVQIQGASDSSFNGIYLVSNVGPSSTQFSYSQTGATLPDANATGGTLNYSEPLSAVGLGVSTQGIGINTETQQAVLVDPSTGGVVTFFNLIDQSNTSLTLETNKSPESGTTAAAYNPLTNTVVAVNSFTNTVSIIDPSSTPPRRLNDTSPFQLNTNCKGTGDCAVAVAVDPGPNLAVIANQGDGSVTVLSLGSIKSFSITETSPKTFVTNSTLGSGPTPSAQTLTVIGKGLNCLNGTTNLNVRLDGLALQTFCTGSGDRELTATVPPVLLSSARRFALDVADSSGNVTNAEDFTVEQSVDVSNAGCPAPQPSGVAIDPQQNIASVTLFGCNTVALIDMASGTGQTVQVGTGPVGVAVLPRLHVAVVANNVSNNASVVDELQQSVLHTVVTGSAPTGAAADQDTSEVAIANNVGNSVTVVNAATFGTATLSTGQGPLAVGFDYVNHQLAVAAFGSSSLGLGSGSGGSTTPFPFPIAGPTSVVYDPLPSDCGSNTGTTTTNTVGCFMVNSSQNNVVFVIDPVTSSTNSFRIGIGPTSIGYNYLTGKLVSTSSVSHTMTVADFPGQKIRAVLPLPPPPVNSNLAINGVIQFAFDIHPFENVAVVADTANGRVLFIPLPY